MLALYGHPFSSYTWKALIPLYDRAIPFAFRSVEDTANSAIVTPASPLGKFPLLVDGDVEMFEATAIIEWLAATRPEAASLVPALPEDAARARMIDRVLDNYVMNVMTECVLDAVQNGTCSPQVRTSVEDRLGRAYRWLEGWLPGYRDPGMVTLVECAAAPALFYADWVLPIPADCPALGAWRARLLSVPAVSRCIEDARPYRAWFPLGAPDRD